MRERVYIQLSHDDGTARWLAVDTEGRPSGVQEGALTEAAEAANGRGCTVIVPGTDVLLADADVPTRNRKQLLRALPYALEDHLADEPEALHFCPAQQAQDGKLPTGIVARRQMDAWLELLTEAGVKPDYMLPENLALPAQDDQWSVFVENGNATVRTGPYAGFSVETENLPTTLDMALQQSGAEVPARLQIITFNGATDTLPDVLAPADVELHQQQADGSALETIAATLNERETINLLQGPYSRAERLGKRLRPWIPAAIMLLIWIGIQVGTKVVSNQQLHAESVELRAAIEKTYRDAFPEARNIVNPRVQMERQLAKLRGGNKSGSSGLLELVAATGRTLQAAKGIEPKGMAYRNGQLTLELVTNNIQLLDRLKQDLAALEGLEVELQSASARGNEVVGRIAIKRPR